MKKGLLRGRDFVILGLENWDDKVGSKNASNIAREIAKDNRVLFVNLPLEVSNIIRKPFDPVNTKRLNVFRGKEQDIQQVDTNIWKFYPKTLSQSVNWIKNGEIFDKFNRKNSKLLAAKINEALEALGFDNVILLNDNELFRCFYLKEYLNPALSVFYIRDFITGVDYWNRHGSRLEPELLAKSDVVVANSTYYADYAANYNNNSYFVGQGCDLSLFKPDEVKELPEPLKNMSQPIIGYVGALTTLRLDINILEHIAEQRPDWNLVLVGTEDEDFRKSRLHDMKNVHFAGQQNIVDLPNWIAGFDVCLNPQQLNKITIGNYPLKLDEYLAMGKPVIATKTRAMDFFSQHVYLADSKEAYVGLIEKALLEDDPEKRMNRRKFAASHTWDQNVKNIYQAILKTESNKMAVESL
ncbi:glycosyltransferase [Cytophagaceae bacterium ABcell3]|nr:glycosyltransferase [Cytophagaceae bacterium ABcell3]